MGDAAVRVTGLRRRFGGVEAVAELSLTVAPGELHALVGANGAGKTTALRLLSGLAPCDGGEGEVLGRDLRRRPREVAASVGYMAQGLALHAELTVRETLRFRAEVYGLARPRERVEALIERFGLGSRRDMRAGRLSGGWARRLQLAATLMHAPRLLLLDEPATGLDYEAQRALWREIATLADEGTAVIVNTHDPAEAARCTRVTILARGRVAAVGTPDQLIARAGVQRIEDAWPVLLTQREPA